MLRKNKTFRKLFLAYGLTTLGDWFDFIAVTILLGFVWQADPMTMALLPIAYAAPRIVLGQFAGVLADRVKKVNLMMATDVIRAGFTLLLLAMPAPGWFLAVLALRSCACVFNDPAQQALTRRVVAPDQLLQATSLNGAIFQMGKLIGPLLGGTIAALMAPAICLIVNACSFLLSAALLFTIRRVEENAHADGKREATPFRQSWKEGWIIFMHNRLLLVSILFSLLALMAIQLADAQFVVLMREKVPGHPEMIGYKTSSIGMGALLTVTWLHRRKDIHSYGWVLGGGVLLIGVCFAWLGLYQPGSGMYWLLVAAFLGGIGTGFTTVGTNYLLQKETPIHAVGRVRGIVDSLSSAIFIVAPLLGGLLITTWGVSLAFQWIGGLIASIGALAVLGQRWIWGVRPASAAGASVSTD